MRNALLRERDETEESEDFRSIYRMGM